MFGFNRTSAAPRNQRRRNSKTVAILAGAASLAVAIAGCTGPTTTTKGGNAPTAANTLIVYTGTATDFTENFNPFSPSKIGGSGSIYEPLFYYNVMSTGKPVPRLGTAFAWNSDGTQLTVDIRSGVTWSDGKPFTAADVVYTLDLLTKNPELNAVGYNGTAKASDDTHVVITFPSTSFVEAPNVLGQIDIVPQHIWEKVAAPATDLDTHPVGTGPYTLGTFKPQAFTLDANPKYWGGAPAVKAVRYDALSGNQAGLAALQAGTVDWETSTIPDTKNVEKNYPGYKQITTYQNQVTLDTCSNTQLGCTGPQTDVAVRKAIYYAMDRTQLNKLAYDGIANIKISPGLALAPRDKDLITAAKLAEPYAPATAQADKARSLLEEDGYTKGSDGYFQKNGKRLSLTVAVVSGYTDYIAALQAMTQQLKEAGIELVTQQSAYNEWTSIRSQGRFQLLMDGVNQGSAPDPYYPYYNFFATATTAPVGKTANQNYSRFSNPTVDAALKKLQGIDPSDAKARTPEFATIQNQVADNMPYIPVLIKGKTSVYNAEKFSGWPTESNLYAYPNIAFSPDNSQVFITLKPAGSK